MNNILQGSRPTYTVTYLWYSLHLPKIIEIGLHLSKLRREIKKTLKNSSEQSLVLSLDYSTPYLRHYVRCTSGIVVVWLQVRQLQLHNDRVYTTSHYYSITALMDS